MASLELQWLTSTAPNPPLWTVASQSTALTLEAVAALAGFELTITEGSYGGGNGDNWRIQTIEVRTVIRQLSSLPGGATWTAVEVVPRFLTGDRNNLLLGNFQVALLLVHDDDTGAQVSVGAGSVMPNASPSPLPLDSDTSSTAALVAGFNTTFSSAQNEVLTVKVSGVDATVSSGSSAPTITLDGAAETVDSSGNKATGSVDVGFLAWTAPSGATPPVWSQAWTVSTADLASGATQTVTFDGVTSISSAVVAINSFSLGWNSAAGDSDAPVNTISIQVTSLSWSSSGGSTQVVFTATANLVGMVSGVTQSAADLMAVTFAVIATP